MQISTMDPVALSPANAQQQVSNQAQVSLARKVMDVQKQQAATLLRQLDGVGQNLDVRV
ncbi:MAG: YjfB family protein [Fimbriimonadales bacterium]|nr:YjfB family protein [Fimbriimonadales bacterium]